ncbi:MAG: hypothetical protein V3U92_09205 [Cellulophaga sp.]
MSTAKPTLMTMKMKSVLYFFCFMASVLMYNNMESTEIAETTMASTELAQVDIEEIDSPQVVALKEIE